MHLVAEHRARPLLGPPPGHVDGVIFRGDGRGLDHLHLRSERAHHRQLLATSVVRYHQQAAVPAGARDERQTHAGAPGGGLHQSPAGGECARSLGLLHHGRSNPILAGPAWVGELGLGEDRAPGRP